MDDRREAMMKRLADRHEKRVLGKKNLPATTSTIDIRATEKVFLTANVSELDMKTPIQKKKQNMQETSENFSPIRSFDEKADQQIVALATWCNTMLDMEDSEEMDLGSNKMEACRRIQSMLANKGTVVEEDENKGMENSRYHRIFEKNDAEMVRKKCRELLIESGIGESVRALIEKNTIAVRQELSIYSDLALQTSLLRIFLSFHPAWLKASLEAVFNTRIQATRKTLLTSLSKFIIDKVFSNAKLLKNKKYAQGSGKPIVTAAGKEALHRHFLEISMKMMFIIEMGHLKKIIPNLTRVFTRKSNFKALDEIFTELSKEIMSGSSLPMKRAFAKIGFSSSYKQTFIDDYYYHAKSFDDFSNGVILGKVVETVGELKAGTILNRLRDPSGDRIRKLKNMEIVLAEMEKIGISTDGVTAAEIVAGKKQPILTILWSIIGVNVASEKKIRNLNIPRIDENERKNRRRSTVSEDLSEQVLKMCQMYGNELGVDVPTLESVLDGVLLARAWHRINCYGMSANFYPGNTLWEKIVRLAEHEMKIGKGIELNLPLFVKMFFEKLETIRMFNEKAVVIQRAWQTYLRRKTTPKMLEIVMSVMKEHRETIGARLSTISFNNATFTVDRDSIVSNSEFNATFKIPKTPRRSTILSESIYKRNSVPDVIPEEDDEILEVVTSSSLRTVFRSPVRDENLDFSKDGEIKMVSRTEIKSNEIESIIVENVGFEKEASTSSSGNETVLQEFETIVEQPNNHMNSISNGFEKMGLVYEEREGSETPVEEVETFETAQNGSLGAKNDVVKDAEMEKNVNLLDDDQRTSGITVDTAEEVETFETAQNGSLGAKNDVVKDAEMEKNVNLLDDDQRTSGITVDTAEEVETFETAQNGSLGAKNDVVKDAEMEKNVNLLDDDQRTSGITVDTAEEVETFETAQNGSLGAKNDVVKDAEMEKNVNLLDDDQRTSGITVDTVEEVETLQKCGLEAKNCEIVIKNTEIVYEDHPSSKLLVEEALDGGFEAKNPRNQIGVSSDDSEIEILHENLNDSEVQVIEDLIEPSESNNDSETPMIQEHLPQETHFRDEESENGSQNENKVEEEENESYEEVQSTVGSSTNDESTSTAIGSPIDQQKFDLEKKKLEIQLKEKACIEQTALNTEMLIRRALEKQQMYFEQKEKVIGTKKEMSTHDLAELLRAKRKLADEQRRIGEKLARMERKVLEKTPAEERTDAGQELNQINDEISTSSLDKGFIASCSSSDHTSEETRKWEAAILIQKVFRGYQARKYLKEPIEQMKGRVQEYNDVLAREHQEYEKVQMPGNGGGKQKQLQGGNISAERKLERYATTGLTHDSLAMTNLAANIIDRLTSLVPGLTERFVVNYNGIQSIFEILKVADRGYAYVNIIDALFRILCRVVEANNPQIDVKIERSIDQLVPRMLQLMLAHRHNQQMFSNMCQSVTVIARKWPDRKAYKSLAWCVNKLKGSIRDPQSLNDLAILEKAAI